MDPTQRLFDSIRTNAASVQPLLLNAPTSEWSVVFLLGQISVYGGFQLVQGSGGFPDCRLRIDGEDVKAELELTSGEYLRHRHSMTGCDAVICWESTAELPIPTLVLSPLFPGTATPSIAQIAFEGKLPALNFIFQHFKDWLLSRDFASSGSNVRSETNTLKFYQNGKSICSVQFLGPGANEFVRFRFNMVALTDATVREQITRFFKSQSDGRRVRYTTSKVEERIDLYPGSEDKCNSLTDGLDHIMKLFR